MGNIHIRTFGCQMNVHDSDRMRRIMEAAGWVHVEDPAFADAVVVNTCSVRQKAWHKVRSAVGKLATLPDGRRGAERRRVVVVAGCVARQEGRRWIEMCPHVDIVLGPDAISRLPAHLEAILDGAPPIVDVEFDEGRAENFPALPSSVASGAREVRRPDGAPTAYVTVMKGCSFVCAYCIVPFVRGPMRHRPGDDIVAEVRELVSRGVREVTLLGQTVNAWRAPGAHGSEGRDFAWLLGRLDEVKGLERVRYTSPHPVFVTGPLVEAHARLHTLCEHLHLPVQSGSDRVLERMGRRHGRDHYLDLAKALLAARPGFTLSSDLIVGFPGETEEDFAQTLELVERAGFDTFFSFLYSPRPGTVAATWDDDVPASLKLERLERLHALGARMTAESTGRELGAVVQVLVEGWSRAGAGQLTGRTRNNRIVNFQWAGEGPAPVGRLLDVEITRVLPHSLLGEIT